MEVPDYIVYALLLPLFLFVIGMIIYICIQFIIKGYNFARYIYMSHIENKMFKEVKNEI